MAMPDMRLMIRIDAERLAKIAIERGLKLEDHVSFASLVEAFPGVTDKVDTDPVVDYLEQMLGVDPALMLKKRKKAPRAVR